jgi:hypothetical protein
MNIDRRTYVEGDNADKHYTVLGSLEGEPIKLFAGQYFRMVFELQDFGNFCMFGVLFQYPQDGKKFTEWATLWRATITAPQVRSLLKLLSNEKAQAWLAEAELKGGLP